MAGAVDDFAPGSVTYFEHQQFYLVRSESAEFTAFYDLDPYQQGRSSVISEASNCRLVWYSQEQWLATFGGPTHGLTSGAFREPCQNNTFSPEGKPIFGPAGVFASLDRYEVSVTGLVSVDLAKAICGRWRDGAGRPCPKATRNFF